MMTTAYIFEQRSFRFEGAMGLIDYASSKAELSDLDLHHAQGEVDRVAQGRYDWRIERGERNMSL